MLRPIPLLAVIVCLISQTFAAPRQLSKFTQRSVSIHATNEYEEELELPPTTFFEQAISRTTPKTPGAKIANLKYGPYHIPAMGMLENKMEFRVAKPCTDCFIVALQADLLSASTNASVNVNEGAWLHHMALYNTGWLGTGPRDPICWLYPTRIFASGNERTPIRLNGRYEVGLEVGRSDNLMMIVELMNESERDQDYYVQMTYEYLPRAAAKNYKAAQVAFMDVGGCWTGGEVPAQTGRYELKSAPWTSTYSGRLLSATGHTHDAGQEVIVYKNGRPVCRAPQVYGNKTEYFGGMSKSKHISDTGTCLDFGDVQKGDQLMIGARYDTNANQLDKEMDGKGNRPLMGISVVYIG